MRTLLSPSEIKDYTGLDLRVNPCNFRDIYNVEYSEARQRLGMDFYNDLLGALVDYSAVADYVGATTYNVGDVVKFQGVYYVAKEEVVGVAPTVLAKWGLAPKFEGDCGDAYNELWCNYLAPYLANLVLAQRLPYIWTKMGDVGVVEVEESVSEGKYNRLQNAINRDKERAWNNLSYYLALEENAESVCFENFRSFNCGENGTGTPIYTGKYRGGWRFG